ncbi:MAG: molybdenum ABC transporter substrate-binding protein, partial [Rhodocyclaceae bacterium]
MTTRITGISSMATRQILTELAEAYRKQCGVVVTFESVGGVDAAKRVRNGEPFDLVVLAADAIDKLIAAGRIVADSKTDLVRS